MSKDVFDEPSNVVTEDGLILVDGPDGIVYAMTPNAALETGQRLVSNAQAAMERDGLRE